MNMMSNNVRATGTDAADAPPPAISQQRPVILLTGFGPFPTVAANATSVLVPRIAAAAQAVFPGTRIAHRILPTEWRSGLLLAETLYRDLQPSIALHFGVSGRATGFEIETRGRNRCSPSQDAAGLLPALACLNPAGPEYLACSVPAAHIAERLRRRGIPAQVSRDAGGYLCNALLYRAQELARGLPQAPRCGFIHLPASLVNERNPKRGPLACCRLSWDDAVAGSIEAIAACLGRASAPPLPARLAVQGLMRR